MSSPAKSPVTVNAITRRGFLSVVASGSLVLATRVSGVEAIARLATGQTQDSLPFEPDIFVAIEPSGLVRILAHRSEMGTGIRTALPMVVADELGADWRQVEIKQSIGDL